MGEVAVIEAGDCEHPDDIEGGRQHHGRGLPTHPGDAQTHGVHADEGKHPQPVDPLARASMRQYPRSRAVLAQPEVSRDRKPWLVMEVMVSGCL